MYMTTIVSVFTVGMLVLAGCLFEARRRYTRMRMDQRFCQLSRQALL
jgi:hypothetical protein